ncbi:interleukin-17 receptor C [Morone saxatilis]|uniref:interleukin-17 receptor C n=1 Tax=Morone saxatilis TaxID=34816 RepID=UPI0015E206FC|nr:interleukin-17 receptor C [Morone saxatilis]
MFLPGWSVCCVLLTLRVSACVSEISEKDDHEVNCSQGLFDCIRKNVSPLSEAENDADVDVQKLTAYFKFCCKDRAQCVLCLVIDTEININLSKTMENEDHSGGDDEDYSEETRNPKASVTVCYKAGPTMPTCKKVEFTVNHTASNRDIQAKISMVITKPAGITFSSHVRVYSKPSYRTQDVVVPSLNEVCSQELQERVEECHVPELRSVINRKMNQVELQSVDSNKSFSSVCVKYESNGRCQNLDRTTIPLYSVTHCMCFQVWDEKNEGLRRTESCPFINRPSEDIQRNLWQNVSVSVGQGQTNDYLSMLWWNLSAPCRLEGEVWPCHKESHCREIKDFKQQLTNETWIQNRKGMWEKNGVFEDINLQLSPCVMVKVKGMAHDLGPFCFNNTDRWRWSLLVVGVMLLICLTVLIFYLFHDFVKKWVWSWHHGGFVKIGRKQLHVVLLSPPDVDDGVSEAVCRLGSLLCNQGFSVLVDQWSRKEQCTLGPLPWLHSQLLELNSQGGRVVLVLTRKALEKVEEWSQQHKEGIKTKGEDKGLSQIVSPYSDVFTASLCIIQADKQLGRAGERFLLVKFDSHADIDRRELPELLQGLMLFQIPSETQALLTELTVGGTRTGSGGKTWTGWKWSASERWRAKTKEEPHCKCVGVQKTLRQSL